MITTKRSVQGLKRRASPDTNVEIIFGDNNAYLITAEAAEELARVLLMAVRNARELPAPAFGVTEYGTEYWW